MTERLRNLFPRELSRDQVRDTGCGLALAALVASRLGGWPRLVYLSAGLLFLAIAAPRLLRPLARGWLGLLRAVGVAASAISLRLLFFLLVVPIGLVRRVFGADDLQLRKWRDGSASVFKTRGRAFEAGDLEAPY